MGNLGTGEAAGNTTTSASGTYTVGGLAGGSYRVHVNATAQGIPIQYYVGSPTPEGATAVDVVDDTETPNINFTMATAGRIVGTVFQSDGTTPISEADVWATRFDGKGGGRGARTESDGRYAIDGLASGTYRVAAAAEGQGFVHEYYNEAAEFELATAVVVVTATVSSTAINFTLAAGGSIGGTVYADDGTTTLAGVHVWAGRYDGEGGNATTTDDQGQYLIPGDYRVRAEPAGAGQVGEFYNDTTDWSQAERVTVASGTTTGNIDFLLATGGSISGTVTREGDGTPVAGADVWAHTYECCGGGNGTTTASDGSYTIPGLSPGEYRVQVRPHEEGLSGEFFASTMDWSLAGRVAVTAGGNATGVDFTLPAGGAISGLVTQSDGTTAISDVFVQASDFDTGAYASGAPTARDGTYTISGLPAGSYRVETWVPDELNFAREYYPSTTDWDLAQAVVVVVGTTTPDIDFTLDGGGSISGRVLQSNGVTPIANANVWADSYVCCGGGNGTQSWRRDLHDDRAGNRRLSCGGRRLRTGSHPSVLHQHAGLGPGDAGTRRGWDDHREHRLHLNFGRGYRGLGLQRDRR